MVRRTNDGGGSSCTWALFVGDEPLLAIRTTDSVPKSKAVQYLFKELMNQQ